MLRTISTIIASLGGVGYFPIASGTAGSLASLPIIFYIIKYFHFTGLAILITLSFMVGVISTHYATIGAKDHDPSYIVIDELLGQAITFTLVTPYLTTPNAFWVYVLGFVFFRIFDTMKVQPAYYIDTSFNNAFGVMLDDAVAGIYAALALYGVCISTMTLNTKL